MINFLEDLKTLMNQNGIVEIKIEKNLISIITVDDEKMIFESINEESINNLIEEIIQC